MSFQIVARGDAVITNHSGIVTEIKPNDIVWEGEHLDVAVSLNNWLQKKCGIMFDIREKPKGEHDSGHKCPL